MNPAPRRLEEGMTYQEIDILLQMEALICEREGMVAENMQREAVGSSMAYTHDNFMILAGQFEQLREILKK